MNIKFNKEGNTITIQAQPEDLFAEVCFKYMQKLGINNVNNLSFFYNITNIPYDSFKSLSELGIPNGGVIKVQSGNNSGTNKIEYLNVFFIINGRSIMVQGQSDMKFSDLATKFITKAALKPEDQPKFIFNSVQIPPNSTQTLKQLSINNSTKIDVFMEQTVIGA